MAVFHNFLGVGFVMRFLTCVLLLWSYITLTKQETFVSEFNKSFKLMCPRGKIITYFGNEFNKGKSDRKWTISCYRSIKSLGALQPFWMDYVNENREQFLFRCPPQSVLSGIIGTYLNGVRKYKFQCTHIFRFRKGTCFWTKNENKTNHLTYDVSIGRNNYFDGMVSYKDNSGLARYHFQVCKLISNGC